MLADASVSAAPTVLFASVRDLPLLLSFPSSVTYNTFVIIEESVIVTVAPTPDAVAVTVFPTKFTSPTLPAVPTTKPSSLTEKPANAPT